MPAGSIGPRELLARTWRRFWEYRMLDRSAVLSFYFLLALFPLILLLTSTLGMVLESGPVLQDVLREYLSSVLPRSASRLIDTTLGEIRRHSGALKFSFALLFTWWSAAKSMLAIVDGLNIAYAVGEARVWWKKYLVASALTIVLLALFGLSLVLSIEGRRLAEEFAGFSNHGDVVEGAWHVIQWLLVLAVVITAFDIVYAFAPNVERRHWRWLTPGTAVAVPLWLLTSFGFRAYLRYFNHYSVTYGSIGAVIILLLWLYLSGAAILVGGIVNSEIRRARDEDRAG